MTLIKYLNEIYGTNEPIFLSEISFQEYSRPWLYKEIKKLCDKQELIKYDKGVYYIPTKSILGISKLDPRKVIEKKYIRNGDKQIGYYSGMSLMNRLGLTTQMPNAIELYTNQEAANVRMVFEDVTYEEAISALKKIIDSGVI